MVTLLVWALIVLTVGTVSVLTTYRKLKKDLLTLQAAVDQTERDFLDDLAEIDRRELEQTRSGSELLEMLLREYPHLYGSQSSSLAVSKVGKNNRVVFRRPDGEWVNKRNDSDRASSVHTTQRDAENAAREMLKNQGGGELITKGENGQIRSKDTIQPASDPNPPKDKEH